MIHGNILEKSYEAPLNINIKIHLDDKNQKERWIVSQICNISQLTQNTNRMFISTRFATTGYN